MANSKRPNPGAALIKISRSYPVESDEHYIFCYLAKPLAGGTAHSRLNGMTLSDIKQTVFDKQHSEEAVSLMRMLFLDCDDPNSSDMLKQFDTNSSPKILFTGKKVEEDRRASYNFRRMLVYVANNLDETEKIDMISLLRQEVDYEQKGSSLQTLLHLFERATQGSIILPQKLDGLKDWLADLDRQDLVMYVNQFEPKKQFPGKR